MDPATGAEEVLVTGDLQNVREIQRQKWMAKKEQAAPDTESPKVAEQPQPQQGASSSSSSGAAPEEPQPERLAASSADSQEEGSLPPVRRLHILPFAEADAKIGGQSRIECLAPELRRKRQAGEIVTIGDMISHNELNFCVTNIEPELGGPLGSETDYFFDGAPLVSLEKIQFSCWGPDEMTADALFAECLTPYFKGEYRAYGTPGVRKVRLFQNDMVFKIGEISLHVEATDPVGPCMGVVTIQTEIFANWDKQAEFDKIHIVPFQDTLPRAYDYDIFSDYLRPYLDRNKHKKMQQNDLFTYQGVQFKVVACDPPENPARVGKGTTIFCEGVLHPSLRNLLPPELLHQVSQLPPGLQMLLLNTERTTRELEDMLSHRRGLFEETLTQLESFEWPPGEDISTTQTTCMVCLSEWANGNECRRLPCGHVFHASCIDEWLRRCTDCPICKANVDRAIRNY